MFTDRHGHAWHMALMVGILAAAFWSGASAGTALLLAWLACAATMAALMWIAVRAPPIGAVEPPPFDHHREAAVPEMEATRRRQQLDHRRCERVATAAISPRRSR